MKTVNSLSGGKTSSYIAVHYPADLEIFSMVCIEDHNAAGWLKRDKSLMNYARNKLERFNDQFGQFNATAEDPIIIKTMRDLEQKLGKNIVWVRGESFEKVMQNAKAIPNRDKRFCTTELKLRPIFNYCYLNIGELVEMRLGYRHDESHRSLTASTSFKFPHSCNFYGQGRQKHKLVEWRKNTFPLIDDKIIHYHIKQYWDSQSIIFPEDSNCQMCFWKNPQQLRKNFDTNPSIMKWAGVQEAIKNRTFKDDINLFQISKLGIQQDFLFGTGTGCNSGFCTD